MTRRRHAPPPAWVKDGATCYYQPVTGRILGRRCLRFAGTIEGEPWQLGDGAWVVNVRDLEVGYGVYTGTGRTRVNAALMEALSPRRVTAGGGA